MHDASRPRVYLSSWREPLTWGPTQTARTWTIMGAPRTFERGQGQVVAFVPAGDELTLMRAALEARRRGPLFGAGDLHADPMNHYQRRLTSRWAALLDAGRLAPGRLTATPWHAPDVPVHDGDTLCCACVTGQDCHRRWIAPFLIAAGWDVVLNGVPVERSSRPHAP